MSIKYKAQSIAERPLKNLISGLKMRTAIDIRIDGINR
jgi:hypothetical protein